MALEAVIAGRSPVLQYGNVRYLLRVWSARPDRVAFFAANAAAVITMPKDGFETILRRQCPAIGSQLVTDVAAADLALSGVAAITVGMGTDT